jgi:hypothetical protein
MGLSSHVSGSMRNTVYRQSNEALRVCFGFYARDQRYIVLLQGDLRSWFSMCHTFICKKKKKKKKALVRS